MENRAHLVKITEINEDVKGRPLNTKNGIYRIKIEIPSLKIKIKLPMVSDKVVDEIIESAFDGVV